MNDLKMRMLFFINEMTKDVRQKLNNFDKDYSDLPFDTRLHLFTNINRDYKAITILSIIAQYFGDLDTLEPNDIDRPFKPAMELCLNLYQARKNVFNCEKNVDTKRDVLIEMKKLLNKLVLIIIREKQELNRLDFLYTDKDFANATIEFESLDFDEQVDDDFRKDKNNNA